MSGFDMDCSECQKTIDLEEHNMFDGYCEDCYHKLKQDEITNKGLLPRYKVEKTDGTPIDPKAKYFVLRYDKYGTDRQHIVACQLALFRYAENIEEHIPKLAEDLRTELAKNKL